MNNVFVALGNQLFEPEILIKLGCEHVFMSEDFELCRYEKHHKLKLYLFLTAMREYRDELEDVGLSVQYSQLEDRSENETFLEHLVDFATHNNIQQLNFFEIEDKPFEKILLERLTNSNIKSIVHSSPNFLFSREEFHLLNKDKKVFRMANFYQQGRKKFDILIDENQKPIGGKWSFDQENRKKIPAKTPIPEIPNFELSKYHESISSLINEHFSDHPGYLNNPWFPINLSLIHI